MPVAVTGAAAEPEHQMSSAVQLAEVQPEESSVKVGFETDSDLVVSEFFVHSI